MNKKAVIAIVVAITLVVGGVYAYKHYTQKKEKELPKPQAVQDDTNKNETGEKTKRELPEDVKKLHDVIWEGENGIGDYVTVYFDIEKMTVTEVVSDDYDAHEYETTFSVKDNKTLIVDEKEVPFELNGNKLTYGVLKLQAIDESGE